MAYALYNKQEFVAKVGDKEIVFTCFGQSRRGGFNHYAVLGRVENEKPKYTDIRNNIIARVNWCNRTWERFTYESVLLSAIDGIAKNEQEKQLLKDLIVEKKHEQVMKECDAFINTFRSLYNRLDEDNKKRLAQMPSIQNEAQAQATLGVMALMEAMQA